MHADPALPALQRGVSILMALTLVVIVTSIISGVALSTNYAIRRSAVLTHGAQASAYAEGGISFAETALLMDSLQNQHDDKDDIWAQSTPAYPVEGGQVTGQIHELSSRFNLSVLRIDDPFEERVFKRLWRNLGGDNNRANAVISAVRNDKLVSVIGIFKHANIEDSTIHRIAPYFCYLPINAEKININWVTPEVFGAYFNLSVARARQILDQLATKPLSKITDLEHFAQQNDIAHVRIDSLKKNVPTVIKLRFDTKSRYFQLVSIAEVGDSRAVAVTTIDRGEDKITRLNQRLSRLANE